MLRILDFGPRGEDLPLLLYIKSISFLQREGFSGKITII